MSVKEIAIIGVVLILGYWLGSKGVLNRFLPS